MLATRDQSTALALSRIWDILSNEMIEAGSRLNLSPPWIANLSSNMCSPSSGCQNGFVSCFKATGVVIFYPIYNDFSPLSVNVNKSCRVSFPFRPVLGETPPTSGLGEVVKLFVKYLNLSAGAVTGGSDLVEYGGGPRWKISGPVDVVKGREKKSISDAF